MGNEKWRVLILGGGFGGVSTALKLAEHEQFEITLVSDREDFRYYPALYHRAVGGKKAASSIPLAEIFNGKNVKLVKDTAKTLDRGKKTVTGTSRKKYDYDYLIVALGVVTNFFGIKGLDKYAYGIKSNDEAVRLRDHIHQQLLDEKRPDINYVIIGGGPTGVELAGDLPHYIRYVMKQHGIKDRAVHVDLVEAAPRLVPRMPKAYSRAVAKRLRKLGVKLYLGQKVEAATADGLEVSGHSIKSHTVVWTAGVTNHPFFVTNEFSLSEHGRVLVDEYMQSEPGIYVIGDNADTPYSGMAQTALYDGLYVAGSLIRMAKGKHPKAYKPVKPITVLPTGPYWAAVQWEGWQVYGWLGWVLRGAADFKGYSDLEPWWKAGKHWMADYELESSCPDCTGAKTK